MRHFKIWHLLILNALACVLCCPILFVLYCLLPDDRPFVRSTIQQAAHNLPDTPLPATIQIENPYGKITVNSHNSNKVIYSIRSVSRSNFSHERALRALKTVSVDVYNKESGFVMKIRTDPTEAYVTCHITVKVPRGSQLKLNSRGYMGTIAVGRQWYKNRMQSPLLAEFSSIEASTSGYMSNVVVNTGAPGECDGSPITVPVVVRSRHGSINVRGNYLSIRAESGISSIRINGVKYKTRCVSMQVGQSDHDIEEDDVPAVVEG